MTNTIIFTIIIFSASIIACTLYLIFHNIAFKNFFKKFKQVTRQRYGFYECGFKARIEKSTLVQLNIVVIVSMALLYDVESLIFIFLMINLTTASCLDIVLILMYIALLFCGVLFDITGDATQWQNY